MDLISVAAKRWNEFEVSTVARAPRVDFLNLWLRLSHLMVTDRVQVIDLQVSHFSPYDPLYMCVEMPRI